MKLEYNRKLEEIIDPDVRKKLRELRYDANISQQEYDQKIEEQIIKQEK